MKLCRHFLRGKLITLSVPPIRGLVSFLKQKEFFPFSRESYSVGWVSHIKIVAPQSNAFEVGHANKTPHTRVGISSDSDSIVNSKPCKSGFQVCPVLIGRSTDSCLIRFFTNVKTAVAIRQTPKPIMKKMCGYDINRIRIPVLGPIAKVCQHRSQLLVVCGKDTLCSSFSFWGNVFVPVASKVKDPLNVSQVFRNHVNCHYMASVASCEDRSVSPQKPKQIGNFRGSYIFELLRLYVLRPWRLWNRKYSSNRLSGEVRYGTSACPQVTRSGTHLVFSPFQVLCAPGSTPVGVVFNKEPIILVTEYSTHWNDSYTGFHTVS